MYMCLILDVNHWEAAFQLMSIRSGSGLIPITGHNPCSVMISTQATDKSALTEWTDLIIAVWIPWEFNTLFCFLLRRINCLVTDFMILCPWFGELTVSGLLPFCSLPIYCSFYINKLSANRIQISLSNQFTYSETVPHVPSHSVMTTLSTEWQPL